MTKTEQAVLRAMHERGEATRPQLAAATGLSPVSIGKAVISLCRRGELREAGEIPSGGGRPVQLYRYNAHYARHILVQGEKEGALLQCKASLLNLHGHTERERRATFAYLEKESLDGLLSELHPGRRLRSITLQLPQGTTPGGMAEHLAQVHQCAVSCPNHAAVLAQETEDGTATICLAAGEVPCCVIRRGGALHESGPLHLLPLPTDWETLDYSERSLVEEMVARLLLIITCTLAPKRIELYTQPLLSTRLTDRIRYNAATKLRGALPELSFRPFSPRLLSRATLHAVCSSEHTYAGTN